MTNQLHRDDEEAKASRNQRSDTRMGQLASRIGVVPPNLTDPSLVKWCLGKAFWSTLVIIGAFLTIKMTIELINQFIDDPTASILNIKFNKTITLPNLTLCLPMDTVKVSRPSIIDDEVNVEEFTNDFFAYLHRSNMTKELFLSEETTWPWSAVQVISRYANALMKPERGNSDMSEVGDETEVADANTPVKNDKSELNVGEATNATWAPSTTQAPRRTKPNVFLALESFIEHSNISLEELVEKAEIEYHKITWERVYEDIVEMHFKHENWTKESFLFQFPTLTDGTWSHLWFHVIHQYLSKITAFENFDKVGLIEKYIAGTDSSDPPTRKAFVALENYLRQLNVSVDELRQKFGHEVQCFFARDSFFIQHSVFRKGSYGSEEIDDGIISLGRTTFVDYNQVCLQLIDPYEFRVKQDALRISFEVRPLQQGGEIYPFYMEVAEAANNVDDSRTYTIDLAGRDMVVFEQADKTDNVIKGRLGENRMASVSISAVYRALSVVRNERRCHDEKSADDCKSECRFNTIRHFYNCTPTSWPTLAPSDGGRCSIAKFIKYRDYDETELYSCMDACLERCTTWRFQIEETIRAEPVGPYDKRAVMDIRVVSYQYPVFEEVFAYTFEQFVGAIGGVLGLWLGLDFLLLIEYLLKPIMFLMAAFFSCKRDASKNGREKSPINRIDVVVPPPVL